MILELVEIIPFESRMIRVGLFPFENRTVSNGSSRLTVFIPTRIASTFERSLCNRSLSLREDNLESPLNVAILPSNEMAALRIMWRSDFTMYYFTSNHHSSNC